jgi:hypothetical protein
MKREQEPKTVRDRGSEGSVTDRRKFLGTSFGAVPLILSTGGSYGDWDGKKKKSLWVSGGKKKDGWGSPGGGGKSGKWYQGKSWADWDQAPRSGGSIKYSDDEKSYSGSSKGNWEWRKWRPEVEESQSQDWQWKKWREGRESQSVKDVPVSHIEKTVRSKE